MYGNLVFVLRHYPEHQRLVGIQLGTKLDGLTHIALQGGIVGMYSYGISDCLHGPILVLYLGGLANSTTSSV